MKQLVWMVLVLVQIGACVQSHHDGVQAVDTESCYTCHKVEYEATVAPQTGGHVAAGFPTTCADCHRNTSWQPALGLHPDAIDQLLDFSIKDGPHVGIKCLVCHDLDSPAPSTNGANTNCVQCHPNTKSLASDHVNAIGAQGQIYMYAADVPNFCLSCHPNGRAHKHTFPKNHRNASQCTDCHDRSAGPDTKGFNVNCEVACHGEGHPLVNGFPGGHRDGHDGSRYTMARDSMMPGPKSFCLQCHATGGGGD